MTKVTVYISTYNYGKYIEKAIQSVLNQTMDDLELIVINDGSTDKTSEILKKYETHPKIRIIEQENRGLTVSNNIALRLSEGKYLMRLDADDYLDENALLVLSNILDSKPEVNLVYPDYYIVDEDGEILEIVRRKKIGEEVELLDLPAHGACTMFRKDCLIQLGGYAEDFKCQDGYEIWLKFIQHFQPYNVNIPLFYYRQHARSLTKKRRRILETRRNIKEKVAARRLNGNRFRVLGLIPVVGSSAYHYGEPFQNLNGKPLLCYTIEEAKRARSLDRVVLASDDDEVLHYADKCGGVVTIKRPPSLSSSTTKMYEIVNFVLDIMNNSHGYTPEAVCTLYINTPLRKAKHIDKAVDTMVVFDVDSVISTEEELDFCYHHDRYGLSPIEKRRDIRIERKAIYKENSAIFLSRREVFRQSKLLGERIGHITMLPEESVKINSEFEFWLAERIIRDRSDLV